MIAEITITGGQLANPNKVISAALRAAMTETVLLLEHAVKPKVPIGVTSSGRGSIAGEVRMGRSVAVGEVIGLVGSPLTHVAVLNDGRTPGKKAPPAEALELWVRRKIKWSTRKGPRGGARRLTNSEARGLAWVIAQKIGREGVPALHFYEDALEQNQERIRDIFARAGLEISMNLVKGS